MRPIAFRARAIVPALLLVAAAHAAAQDVTSTPQRGRCGVARRGLRTVGGATIGGWVGLVAAKIKLSDWNSDAQSAVAHRQRNQAIAIGAVLGAVIANVPFHSSNCTALASRDSKESSKDAGARPITSDEIRQSGVNGSVYDLVYSLRRSWLNTRGVETFNEAPRVQQTPDGREVVVSGEPQLIIYLDNLRMGTLSQLRNLPVTGVTGVRYFTAAQATFRWGAGHSHGAIEVLTVSGS